MTPSSSVIDLPECLVPCYENVTVEPSTPRGLRQSRRGRITRVQGKGNIERTVFLCQDSRLALADYFEKVRHGNADEETTALFLSARALGGKLSATRI
jgi:site-specific recombinase XerD